MSKVATVKTMKKLARQNELSLSFNQHRIDYFLVVMRERLGLTEDQFTEQQFVDLLTEGSKIEAKQPKVFSVLSSLAGRDELEKQDEETFMTAFKKADHRKAHTKHIGALGASAVMGAIGFLGGGFAGFFFSIGSLHIGLAVGLLTGAGAAFAQYFNMVGEDNSKATRDQRAENAYQHHVKTINDNTYYVESIVANNFIKQSKTDPKLMLV